MIGISLGPGDPELLTFKAAAALKRCTKVFVPGEMAAELARPFSNPEILEFPMIEDEAELERIWRLNADTIARHATPAPARPALPAWVTSTPSRPSAISRG